MKHSRWIVGMWLMVVSVTSSTTFGAEPVHSTPIKEQIVKLMAHITMTLNHAVDEKFCRQSLKDFKQQNNVEHVQPIIQADRINDPALMSFLGKCPTVKWIGADDDTPGYRLNTRYRDQFHNLSVGTAHFRLYEVDIDNDGENDREHVFYSDGFVPAPLPGDELQTVDELDKSLGEYTAVDLGNCRTLAGMQKCVPRDFDDACSLNRRFKSAAKESPTLHGFERVLHAREHQGECRMESPRGEWFMRAFAQRNMAGLPTLGHGEGYHSILHIDLLPSKSKLF